MTRWMLAAVLAVLIAVALACGTDEPGNKSSD